MEKLRKAILKGKSIRQAWSVIERMGLSEGQLEVLRTVMEAESEMAAQRSRGGQRKTINPEQVETIRKGIAKGDSVNTIVEAAGINRATYFRWRKRLEIEAS